MLFSAYYLFIHVAALHQLGFPDYFRIELVTAKIVGAILLLIPAVSLRVKEWIYAGFVITMLSALIAHICSQDPIARIIFVSVDSLLIVLAIRYVTKVEYHLANVIPNHNK